MAEFQSWDWWQRCWWHHYVGNLMMGTDLKSWWQNHYVGDFFVMLVISQYNKSVISIPESVIKISNLSPTRLVANICHQHWRNRDTSLSYNFQTDTTLESDSDYFWTVDLPLGSDLDFDMDKRLFRNSEKDTGMSDNHGLGHGLGHRQASDMRVLPSLCPTLVVRLEIDVYEIRWA